jgi:shikimate dehydrogenase
VTLPSSLREVIDVNAAWTVVGVIGDPVGHSLSPTIQNAAFAALGIDAIYVGFPVASGAGSGVVAACRTLGLRGLSVTMPHKEVVAVTADEVSDDVRSLGAANTLTNNGGRIRADTTDGDGCVDALRAAGFDPASKKCMVLGAGGSGRSVVLALGRAGAQVVVAARNVAKAEHALTLGGSSARIGSLEEVSEMDFIVNTTPLGMGENKEMPLDPTRLGRGQVIHDLVYNPLETPLLGAARIAGANTVDGLSMLIHQAVRQIALWTGEAAPVSVMRVAALRELDRRRSVAASAVSSELRVG